MRRATTRRRTFRRSVRKVAKRWAPTRAVMSSFRKRKNAPMSFDGALQIRNPFPRWNDPLWKSHEMFEINFSDIPTSVSTTLAGLPASERIYRLASIFDPIFAVGGGQPERYAVLAAAFTNYQVYKCDVKITFSNASTSTAMPIVALQAFPSVTLVGKALDSLQQVRGCQTFNMSDTGFGDIKCFQKSFSMGDIAGIGREVWRNDPSAYGAAFGANPTANGIETSPLIRVAVADIAATSGTTVYIQVQLKFYGKAWGRIDFTA